MSKKEIKLILIILLAFATLFATTFLLDLQIIKTNFARKTIIYILLVVELLLFFNIIKQITLIK